MTDPFLALLARSKAAASELGVATSDQRKRGIRAIADALEASVGEIVDANASDMARGREDGLAEGLLDRLLLTDERVRALADAARSVADLPDPLGQVVRSHTMPNGVEIEEVRVPFGVIGAIYEARPNVTVDIVCLCLGTGNAVVTRGGSAAERTNRVLVSVMQGALESVGLPRDAVQTIDEFGREGAGRLMRARGYVDLLIPRGSAALIERVVTESTVPVIETGAGIVHVYVHAEADLGMATRIIMNAKTQRPSVCNAMETVLVDRAIAAEYLPQLVAALQAAGVTVHSEESIPGATPLPETGWATEYLGLECSVRVVDGLNAAIEHINRFGTHHTDVIVTEDAEAAAAFQQRVDSAAVGHNVSSRFTDGGEFGFGAEIGISTQKAHARGPMGLPEITSTKWLMTGTGQVRS